MGTGPQLFIPKDTLIFIAGPRHYHLFYFFLSFFAIMINLLIYFYLLINLTLYRLRRKATKPKRAAYQGVNAVISAVMLANKAKIKPKP